MCSLESNAHNVEGVIGEVVNRLDELLQTSLLIICISLGVLIVSIVYLLRPLCHCRRTSSAVTHVRSCPCLDTILPKEDSPKKITLPTFEDKNSLNKTTRKKVNGGIKFNTNVIVENQPEKITATKENFPGPSEHKIEEQFVREVGLPECCKLPQFKGIQD